MNKTVFVIGSKPDATFPNDTPNIIIAVNGAIKLAQRFAKRNVRIIGIVSDYVFNENNKFCKAAFSQIAGCQVNDLIVIKAAPHSQINKSLHDKVIYDRLFFINRWERTKTTLKVVRKRELISKLLSQQNLYGWLGHVFYFIKRRQIRAIKVSTGIFGLCMAISQLPSMPKNIWLIGIGLEPGSGHFYEKTKIYPPNHIAADKLVISLILAKHIDTRIRSTDAELNKYIIAQMKTNQ